MILSAKPNTQCGVEVKNFSLLSELCKTVGYMILV